MTEANAFDGLIVGSSVGGKHAENGCLNAPHIETVTQQVQQLSTAPVIAAAVTLTAADTDQIHPVNSAAGGYAITLPTAANMVGLSFKFVHITDGAGVVTFSPGAATLIGTIVEDDSCVTAAGTTLSMAAASVIGDHVKFTGVSATQILVEAFTSANGGFTVA
jgi:hypothetical protein